MMKMLVNTVVLSGTFWLFLTLPQIWALEVLTSQKIVLYYQSIQKRVKSAAHLQPKKNNYFNFAEGKKREAEERKWCRCFRWQQWEAAST
jgi:hypothetical protein